MGDFCCCLCFVFVHAVLGLFMLFWVCPCCFEFVYALLFFFEFVYALLFFFELVHALLFCFEFVHAVLLLFCFELVHVLLFCFQFVHALLFRFEFVHARFFGSVLSLSMLFCFLSFSFCIICSPFLVCYNAFHSVSNVLIFHACFVCGSPGGWAGGTSRPPLQRLLSALLPGLCQSLH